MLTVSEAPPVVQTTKKFQSYNPNFKTDQEKKDEVMFRCLLLVVM